MRSLLLALALLLAAVAASAQGPDAPRAPPETPGDFTTIVKDLGQGYGNIVFNESVYGAERVFTRLGEIEAVKRVAYQNGTLTGVYPMTWVMKTTTWSLPRDGGVVRTTFNSTIVSPDGVQQTNITTFHDPPCPLREWPLEVGKEWLRSCVTYGSVYVNETPAWRNETLKVVGEETLSTPRGPLRAFLIDHYGNRSTPSMREWYAPDACGVVKMLEYDGKGRPGASWELAGYACAVPVDVEAAVDVETGLSPIDDDGTPPADDGGDAGDATPAPKDEPSTPDAGADAPADDPWSGAVPVDAEDPPKTGASVGGDAGADASGGASGDDAGGEPLLPLGETPAATATGDPGAETAPVPGPGLALAAVAVGLALWVRRR